MITHRTEAKISNPVLWKNNMQNAK